MSIELRGARQVRHAIAGWARAELPRYIGGCREAWDLTAEQLPLPVDYLAREPQALDQWPCVYPSVGRRRHAAQDRTAEGEQQFAATYDVRLFSWVRTEGWDACQDQRDDLAAAITVALLSQQTLGGTGLTVVEGTLIVEPSDVESVKGSRFLAGSYVGFDVTATETLTDRLSAPGEQPRPRVETIHVTGELHGLVRPAGSRSPLATHPALL